jgi:large subunit ribosomal protein L1
MPQKGKKYIEVRKLIEPDKLYKLEEAVTLIKKMGTTKFEESVELAVKLGIDSKKKEEVIRGTVVLPHGQGKRIRVLVFARGEKLKEAQDSGADYAGGEELIKKIEKGWLDFDAAISTPDMMREVGKLGRILGPRGLMPNPKLGTVTIEISKAIKELKAGKVEYKADSFGIVHLSVGKLNFEKEKILENLQAIFEALLRAKPSTSKGQYFRSITISPTMGPGIKVASQSIQM